LGWATQRLHKGSTIRNEGRHERATMILTGTLASVLRLYGNNLAFGECRIMDQVEEIVAPAAIERALEVYQQLKPCKRSVLLQARKIVTQHVYGLVDKGERDEQRLTAGGLVRLKAVERDHVIRSAGDNPSRKAEKPRSVSNDTQLTDAE
jgi:hypothetical protein